VAAPGIIETLNYAGRANTGRPRDHLTWICRDLQERRFSRPQLLELARAMERALVLLECQLHPPRRRPGAQDQFMTFRDAGLVNALTRDRVFAPGEEEARRQALDHVAGGDSKKRERIYRYVKKNGGSFSHDPVAYAQAVAAAKRRPKVHRIK
jgi:hypothetical protein